MSPRARVYAVVAASAVVVIAAVVAVTYLQARGETTTAPGAVTKPHAGFPPLLFDFGTRDDAQAKALAQGASLLRTGKRAQAAAIFARYHSVQAQIGSAFAAWPKGARTTLEHLLALHPHDPVVLLYYAIALYWEGRNADAVKQFLAVDSKFPDSQSSVDAEDILYANRFKQGLPYLLAPVQLPAADTLGGQLAKAKSSPLAYGVIEWQLEHRVSARRAFAAAAAAAPSDPVPQTLLAVSYYSKRNPTAAFSRLGPLTGRFPKAAIVRLQLGELLLWQKEVTKGIAQLRLAAAEQPGSTYAKEAKAPAFSACDEWDRVKRI